MQGGYNAAMCHPILTPALPRPHPLQPGTVSAGNPLFLARAADEEARAMARAQALWDERYTLPPNQVQQARQFLKAGVRVLEESTRRRERAKLGAEAALREQDEAMSAVTSVAPSDAGHPSTAGAGAGSARAASGRALLFAHEAAAAVQSVAGFSMASTSARSLTTTQARALDATQARFGASVQLGIVWSRPLLDRLAHYVESQYPYVQHAQGVRAMPPAFSPWMCSCIPSFSGR